MGGAFWSAVTYGRTVNRNVCPLHTPLIEHSDGSDRRKSTSPDHRPPRSMPPAKATGKERAGARQDSEPAPYSHHLSTVLIDLCVRHSYFIMWRAHVQVEPPTSEIKKKKGKEKTPFTVHEEEPRVKTRAVVAWGMAKSPGGTEHTFLANSGITPDGANDEVKAILRGAQRHSSQPGCSETRPSIVSDSPIAMRK